MTNAQGVLDYMRYKEERERNMTNDEWRKTCSAEEFAEWIFAVWHDGTLVSEKPRALYFKDILNWLKQPHKESK